jgi:hypothetical protein
VKTRLGLAAAVIVFAVLATANSGGYRFGISDQAYYGAAILRAANPALFPRDAPLLDAQSRHMLSDDLIGGIIRWTGIDLPPLFLAIYLVTLVALFAAAVFFARSLGASWWAVATLLLLMTFRHRIAKTGANSLEGYMHTRMLAFALGIAALGFVVRARVAGAIVFLVLAAVMHTTTALWFGIVVGVAMIFNDRRWRNAAATIGAVACLVGAWALVSGPLTGHLALMDRSWLSILEGKDYLFPTDWPIYAWLANLAYVAIILMIFRRRRARRIATPGEPALAAGSVTLVALFLMVVPLTYIHLALAVQLQANRVFWVLDFVAAAYLAVWLADDLAPRWTRGRALLVGGLLILSIGRGYFVEQVQADRRLIAMSLPDTPWTDAMRWLAARPEPWHVLADPGHAWKYGVSVRLAGRKDTLLELGKDTALAMYDRGIAMRVLQRSQALAEFDRFTTDNIRALDAEYDLDVLVVEANKTFDFPVLYRNDGFVVYDLR